MNSTVPAHRVRTTMKMSLLSLFASAALLAPILAASPPPASAATPLPDGTTSRTAAGSCWEAKQNYPTSRDGIYWLLTPALKAPQQFYCDMTTDGGGWVLIARGRDGWKGQYNGLGSADTVRQTVTGPAAFKTAQLPGRTVDELLNNGRVDALPDGVRVKRAKTSDGTQWQEVRFAFSNRDRWVWTFGADHPVKSFSFDGATGSGGLTKSFGTDSAFKRVDTSTTKAQGYVGGIAYGSNVTGTTSADSYLWSKTDGLGAARPFAQMFLRPKLTLADMTFAAIPDAGAPAITQRALPESDAIRTVWGVSGLANGSGGEQNTEVAAFGQIGDTVFVGGNFQYVQRSLNATGADKVEQHYLAAFDVKTGEWIPGFRPVLDGQVKALIGLPDGRLAVGGQFSQANGQPHQSLVVLDPATGQTASGWQVSIENRMSGGVSQVHNFSLQDGWLYLAGSFTHLTRDGGSAVSEWNGARINASTGAPDANWNPRLNGTSFAVDAPAGRDRMYFSGYFRQSGSVMTISATALQTAAGAAVVQPVWAPSFSQVTGTDANGYPTGALWQLGVREAGGRVWLGGSQHSLFTYSPDTFKLMSGNGTRSGGDIQTVISSNNTVFAGCHCGDWTYSETYHFPQIDPTFTQADKINLMGAWDATSGSYLQEFSPVVQARAGYGAWALFVDSMGNLWAGGDFSNSIRAGEVNQWSGGFIRFAPRDAVAPSAPASLTGTAVGDSETLSWPAAKDESGAVSYEVIRGDKVIETTSQLQLSVPKEASPVRYFVRAVDSAGNRSKSTSVFVVSPPAASALTFIGSHESWKWRYDSAPWPDGWRSVGFDDSGWKSGSAVLGFGSSALGTDISVGASSPRPLSAQFRHPFTVTDPTTVKNGKISVIADDGVVVYVNGTEVGRANLPTGTLTQNSYATAVPRSSAAAAAPVVFTVPSSVLVAGTNVVSASTHQNYRSTPDVSFDLTFTAETGTTDAPPPAPTAPAAPVVTATAPDSTSAALTWTHDDGSDVAEYRVARDDVQVGTVKAPTLSFSDSGLTPATTYRYSVVAVDTVGQTSAPGTASVTTPAATAAGPATLVAAGESWKWHYDDVPWAANWRDGTFDDSSWPSGNAVLGWNTAGLGTDISVNAPATRPLAAQFRKTFSVNDPTTVTAAKVTVIANDGVAVYLNGTEIGRANLPTGTVTQGTYATAAPRSSYAAANLVTMTVPLKLLVAGKNVLAASTHLNYHSTPDVSFDLTLSAEY